MHLGILAINALDEFNAFGTPTTRVRRPKYGSHWYELGHVFVEVTEFGMRGTRSEQNYSYKLILKLGGKTRTLGAKIFQ